jgi:hypothetical protein
MAGLNNIGYGHTNHQDAPFMLALNFRLAYHKAVIVNPPRSGQRQISGLTRLN